MTCECGKWKPSGAEACGRCDWLDGTLRAGRLISELRALGGVACNAALQTELGLTRTGVLVTVRSLLKSGRVHRRIPDFVFDDGHRASVIYELRDSPHAP